MPCNAKNEGKKCPAGFNALYNVFSLKSSWSIGFLLTITKTPCFLLSTFPGYR